MNEQDYVERAFSMRHTKCIDRKAKRDGIALVAALIFIMVFMAMSAGMLSMSAANTQTAVNHRSSNTSLNAALSGAEYAKYAISKVSSISVVLNFEQYMLSQTAGFPVQENALWQNFRASLQNVSGSGTNWIQTHPFVCDTAGTTFTLRFERNAPTLITALCTGSNAGFSRTVRIDFDITSQKEEILSCGLVGRGRMWITGDTTIYGDIYSSWNNANVSPFNMTDDSKVLGTINTIISKSTIDTKSYQLETVDGSNKAMFTFGTTVYDLNGKIVTDAYGTADSSGYLVGIGGQPVYDANGYRVPVNYANRIAGSSDQIQGYHEGINYGVVKNTIDRYLDINTYDTAGLKTGLPDIPYNASATEYTGSLAALGSIAGTRWRYEYFPHNAGSYTTGSGLKLKRFIYKNQTYANRRLPADRNALFINCTFNEKLYIDCSPTSQTSGNCNNVRFENCTFNGVIISNTPKTLSWQRNALYFTGSSNFKNTSAIQQATILAPHFNVDLGDANNGNVRAKDENVITGVVIGGIVDIRGNAKILGTVISMCDTSQWTSGFVTNIGATLNDGGTETTAIEDVGTIEITPDKEQTLFPGLKEYPCTISLKTNRSSYEEIR
jgi:hypothetical protein